MQKPVSRPGTVEEDEPPTPAGTDVEEDAGFVDPHLTGSRTPLYVAAAVLAVGLIAGGVWWSHREPAPEPAQPLVEVERPAEPSVEVEKHVRPEQPTDGVSPSAVVPPASAEVTLRLSSSPPGAEVFDADVKLGTTPLKVARPSARVVELRFSLEGYRPVKRKVTFGKDEDVAVALTRAAAGPPSVAEGHRPSSNPGEIQKPDAPARPDLPSLVADPYADEKNKPSKQLKDVAY